MNALTEPVNYDFHTPDVIVDDSDRQLAQQTGDAAPLGEEDAEFEELLQFAFASPNPNLVALGEELSDALQTAQAKDEDYKSRLLHIETIIMMAKYQLVYIKMENSWKKLERMFSRRRHCDKAAFLTKLAANTGGSKAQKRSVCLIKAGTALSSLVSVLRAGIAKRQSVGLEALKTHVLASRSSSSALVEQRDLLLQCQDADKVMGRLKQDYASGLSQTTSKESSQKIGQLFSRKGTTKSSAGLASATQFTTVREDSFSRKQDMTVGTSVVTGLGNSASQRSALKAKPVSTDVHFAKVLSALANQQSSAAAATKSLEHRLKATENKIFSFIRDLTAQIATVAPGAVPPQKNGEARDAGLASGKLFGLPSGVGNGGGGSTSGTGLAGTTNGIGRGQVGRENTLRDPDHTTHRETSSTLFQNWMAPNTQRTMLTGVAASTGRDAAGQSSSSAIGTTLSFHKVSPHATMTVANTGAKAKRYLELLGNTVKDVHAPSALTKGSAAGGNIVKSGSGVGLNKQLFETKHSAHAVYAATKSSQAGEGLGSGLLHGSTASAKKLPKQANKTGHI